MKSIIDLYEKNIIYIRNKHGILVLDIGNDNQIKSSNDHTDGINKNNDYDYI